MNDLRILLIDTGICGDINTSGAIEYSVYNISKELSMLGYEVIVLTNIAYNENVIKNNLAILTAKLPSIFIKAKNTISMITIAEYKFLQIIRNIIKEYNIDVIHTHSEPIALLLLPIVKRFKSKITFVHTYHNAPPNVLRRDTLWRQTIGLINYRAMGLIFDYYDYIVVPSNYVKNGIVHYFGDKYLDKVTVIPNGVDTNFFNFKLKNKKNRIREVFERIYTPNLQDSYVLLYSGRIEKTKGVHILPLLLYNNKIRSKKMNIKLVIVGRGSYENQLMTSLKDFHNDILKMPWSPRYILRFIYALSDLLLFPSIGEGCPLTPLEAMATGLPVVGFTIEPLIEILNGSHLLELLAKNVKEFINKTFWLLENEDMLKKLSTEATILAQKYSWSNIVYKYITLYEKKYV